MVEPGLEIRVCKSESVRRADKEKAVDGYSYVYAVDYRFIEDPDFQSGSNVHERSNFVVRPCGDAYEWLKTTRPPPSYNPHPYFAAPIASGKF